MRRAGDASGEAQIGDDLLPQRERAAHVGISQVRLRQRPRGLRGQRRPKLPRKRVQRRQPPLKRQRRGQRRNPRPRQPESALRRHLRQPIHKDGNHRPRRATRFDRALAGQQVVGRVDRATRDAELRRQRARRRQPRAGGQRTGGDGRAQPCGDLQVKRPRLARVEGNHGPINQPVSGPG